jgi:hypothetical protein
MVGVACSGIRGGILQIHVSERNAGGRVNHRYPALTYRCPDTVYARVLPLGGFTLGIFQRCGPDNDEGPDLARATSRASGWSPAWDPKPGWEDWRTFGGVPQPLQGMSSSHRTREYGQEQIGCLGGNLNSLPYRTLVRIMETM